MNSDLFQTIHTDPPIEILMEQEAAHELENERMYGIECALRECLTKGVSMKNIRILCSECGIQFSRVYGG